jgi:hypothetical protein
MNTIFLVVFFVSVLLLPAMKAFAIDDNDKNPTSSSNNENPSKTKKSSL